MHRYSIKASVLFGVLAVLPVSGQTTTQTAATSGGSPQRVQAELLGTVKSSKAKPNDSVVAQTVTPLTLTDGTVIPVGSKLLGHVMKAEPDSAEHKSSIAIVFDSVELKKKTKLPLNLSIISAMASTAPSAAANNQMVSPSSGSLPADHPLNGQAYNVVRDAPVSINGHSSISDGKSGGTQGEATAAHTGSVIGLPGVTLEIDNGPPATSTFASGKKNLQLDQGLQLMLAVAQ